MVRKNRRNRSEQTSVEQTLSPAAEAQDSLRDLIGQLSDLQRLGAMTMFFVTIAPLILFALLVVNEFLNLIRGQNFIDPWTFWVILPFGVMFAPVLFYLGWYFESRSHGVTFPLEEALGGNFRAYCVTLYGVLAAVAIILSILGAISTALLDSNLVLISWAGTAFVGIGLVSWLFHTVRSGDLSISSARSLATRPTGIALAMFSAVWLYPCAVTFHEHEWLQFRAAMILFFLFLAPGIIAILLSRNDERD